MLPTPTITQYRAAIENADTCFKDLLPIAPTFDAGGQIRLASGAFAVVFKMHKSDEDRHYAVKCFTQMRADRAERYKQIHAYLQAEKSPFWIDFRYMESELWVDAGEGAEYPIVSMPWVEGITLGESVRSACEKGDKAALHRLLYDFVELALRLLALPAAHGDLKHDNILVGKDGKLYLVDYDGLFVPALAGAAPQEAGSPDYQHPSRRALGAFDRNIDDFSMGIIALSLYALAQNPALFAQYHSGQNLIFSQSDFSNLLDAAPLRGISLPTSVSNLADRLESAENYQILGIAALLYDLQLQSWWENLAPLEREVLELNYRRGDRKLTKEEEDESIYELAENLPVKEVNLWKLVQFKTLVLNGYWYSGIPINSLNFISPFRFLEHLYCRSTRITSLHNLENRINLQTLDCRWTNITSLQGIENCRNLQSLNCGNIAITSLQVLENCRNLQTLNCYHTAITSLQVLENCTNLQTLSCGSTAITSLQVLENCRNLQSLSCGSTAITSLQVLENCRNLQTLNCNSCTNLTSLQVLENCRNLQSLDCAGTAITSLHGLENCVNLQLLNCAGTAITSLHGMENCVNLQILNCSSTKIISLHGLENCLTLQTLERKHTRITNLQGLENCIFLGKID